MATVLPTPPRVGMVSLGCPKALVDSERILTKLRADGYQMSPDYAGADVVLVNTCGFLDCAKEESLEAIGEAIAENGRVIVTGCMGQRGRRHPRPLPAGARGHRRRSSTRQVVDAVHEAAPPIPSAYLDLVPQADSGPAQADPAPLQLSQDLRGLQPPLRLLHHPRDARRPRQPPPRRDPARGREAGRRGDQGAAGHQPGHQRLRRRPQARRLAVEGRAGPRPHDRPRPRAAASSGRRGSGCTTSTPTRTSTASSR